MEVQVAQDVVPEVQAGNTITPVIPNVSLDWNDMEKDMAKIASAANQSGAQPGPIEKPAEVQPEPILEVQQPVQPQEAPKEGQAPATATAQPQIPEKFRASDGGLDKDKILKSYLEMEPQFKRLQNQSRQQVQAPQPQAQPQPVQATQLTPFEAQVAQDFMTEGLDQRAAIAASRVITKLFDAKHQADTAATFARVANLEQTLEQRERTDELRNIAERDPWVLTPEGMSALVSVRQNRPWVNTSPEPWKQAYKEIIADRLLHQNSNSQVNTPTPKALTAPVGPVTAANRNPQPVIRLDSREDVSTYVKNLPKEKEAEFWRKLGYRW